MSAPEVPRHVRSIVARSLHEQRRSLAGWSIGLATIVAVEVALFPTVRANDLSQMLESYPEPVRELFGLTEMSSGTGFVRAELFSLVVPLLLVLSAILWGSDGIAGEEERHTIDLVLTTPTSRRRMLLEKAAAVAIGITVLGLVVFATLLVGDLFVGLDLSVVHLAAAVGSTIALAVLYGWTALGIGAATGHRGLARGLSTALAVAAYLLSSLSNLVDWLRPWRTTSPWYHALGIDPLADGTTVAHLAVLLVLAVAALVLGATAFDRRDLAS